jgi:hypothetical protein
LELTAEQWRAARDAFFLMKHPDGKQPEFDQRIGDASDRA